MDESIRSFLKKATWLAIVIFIIQFRLSFLWHAPRSLFDLAGVAVGLTTILMGVYERWLWRFCPLEKTPKLCNRYIGTITYSYAGNRREKDIVIEIKQSLLAISIKIITDEITSNSINSKLVIENGEHVLYYVYITNPKGLYSEGNPIQYGACRLVLDGKQTLRGIYWTSRKNIGDIVFSDSSRVA